MLNGTEQHRWISDEGRKALVEVGRLGLLAAIAASFVLPKLLLIDFYRGMWVQLSPGKTLAASGQDLALAVAVFLLLEACLPGARRVRLVACAAVSATGLTLLLIEARVRQLFLRPVDLSMLEYAWRNRSDLRSGMHLVLDFSAGWGMTFRRALVLIVGAHLILWALLFATGPRPLRRWSPPRGRRWRWLGPLGRVAIVLLITAAAARSARYRYRLEENVVASPLVELLRFSNRTDARAAPELAFDQRPRPFRETVDGERRFLNSAAPFKNVVLVFLESVRWRDLDLESDSSRYANLRRMAREGLLSRCYVPVPHSSKGYYAVLSGRYPFPGIEMRETMAAARDSFARSLRDRLGARTFALTSMHLQFENTRGLLEALGIDERFELHELVKGHEGTSSFGGDDGPLYEAAAEALARGPEPFVAVLMPSAAHYPYVYPGKAAEESPTHAAYLASLAHTDQLIGGLINAFSVRGLSKDTLFVLVGDHGESFGEHGFLVHNSSLHDEEVTVPLIFWSLDGRMRHAGTVHGRQIDVAPTVLDLLGLRDDASSVQGASLLRMDGPARVYLSTFFDELAVGLIDFPTKHIYEPGTGILYRYDLRADPFEVSPVAVEDDRKQEIVSAMRAFRAWQEASFPVR